MTSLSQPERCSNDLAIAAKVFSDHYRSDGSVLTPSLTFVNVSPSKVDCIRRSTLSVVS